MAAAAGCRGDALALLPVTDRLPPAATLQLLFSIGVDGFFAISGFLITRSWLDDPHIRDYLTSRALRILPGYYVCLIMTAFVFAPLSVAIQGGSVSKLVSSGAPLEYVLKNIGVAYVHLDIGGTPRGVPHSGLWNGSLWSLVAALPLAYAIIASGSLLKDRRPVLRTDLSYGVYIYAFPTQQLLAVCGLARLQPMVLFVVAAVATLPLAAASWFLIEKPSMALKRRLKEKWSVSAEAGGDGPSTTAPG